MHKRTGIFLALGLCVCVCGGGGAVIAHAQTEEITISTYYPAPYGVYSEMRSGRMAVGDNYLGPDYCWPPSSCTNQIAGGADLVVEGRVGIGTVNPRGPIDINVPRAAADTDGEDLFIQAQDAGPKVSHFPRGGNILLLPGAPSILSPTGGQSGFLGIGTLEPESLVHIANPYGGYILIDAGQASLGAITPKIMARSGVGLFGGPPSVMLDGQPLLALRATGYDGIEFPFWESYGTASIAMRAEGDWSPTAHGTAIEFSVTKRDTLLSTRAMVIQASSNPFDLGRVGIGMSIPTESLDVWGNIKASGCVNAGGALLGTCLSDRRLKQNILALSNSLEKVAALSPVTFNWRSEEFPDRHFGRERNYGLVADEVENVLPELVGVDSDGYKTVKYGSELTMFLIQAVKELKAENDELKIRILEIENRLKNRR